MRMLSSSGLRRPAIVSPSLRKDPRRRFPPLLRAADRNRGPGDTSRAGATRARGRGRRPCSLHRIFGARGNRRFAWAPGRHSGGVRASLYPCTAGGLSTLVDVRYSRLVSPRRHDRLSELLAWLDEHESEAGRDQFFRAYRAWSLAKLGQFDEARAIVAVARAEQEERGGAAAREPECLRVRLDRTLGGDPAAAAEFGANGCRMHEELGEHRFLGSAAGSLAQALYALDRLDDADAWAGRAMQISASTDVWAQMLWRQVRAKVLARSGEHGEAQRLALEAVAIGDDTELLDMQGAAYADLGEVLLLTGKADEATAAFEQGCRATSGRRTSSWPSAPAHSWRSCGCRR